MIKYSCKLHEQLINKQKKAIGWGLSADLIYQLKKMPYDIFCLIDGLDNTESMTSEIHGIKVYGPDLLKEMDENQYVIILFADADIFGLQIQQQIRCYGNFSLTLPFCYWQQYSFLMMKTELCNYLSGIKAKLDLNYNHNRIVLLFYGLSTGGADRQIVLLALGLRELGYEVDLITLINDSPNIRDWALSLEKAGVNRFQLPDIRMAYDDVWFENNQITNQRELLKIFSAFGVHQINQLTPLLRKRRPDIAISYMDDANILLGISGLLSGVPNIILSARSMAPSEQINPGKFSIATKAMNLVYYSLLKHSHFHLSTNSLEGKKSYASWIKIPENQITVVVNAIRITDNQRNIRKEYKINDKAYLIVGVMRFVKVKRTVLFVQVIAELKKYFPEIKAILVGDGRERSEIESEIKKLHLSANLILSGEQNSALDFLRAADIMLHTSRVEGMSNVILEAQAVQCPIVSTNVGGCKDALLAELHHLCLVDSENPVVLAKRVVELLKPDNTHYFRTHSAKIMQRHSVQQLALQTLQLTRQFI